jgi:phage gp16-like protein
MEETKIYEKVLKKLFDGLSTEHHEKYKNDKFSERKFSINDLYPDIILTKKDSKEVQFIIEIATEESVIKENINLIWKPLSDIGPTFFLVVPKSKHKVVEKWCIDEKLKVRFGVFEEKNDGIDLKFL